MGQQQSTNTPRPPPIQQPLKPLSSNHFCICQHNQNQNNMRYYISVIGIPYTHPVHQAVSDTIKAFKNDHKNGMQN